MDLEIQLVVWYVLREVQGRTPVNHTEDLFSVGSGSCLSIGDSIQNWVLKVDILGRGKSYSHSMHALNTSVRQKRKFEICPDTMWSL